ncbi:MAG: 30S ribosomal protein S7 [Candidatus Omnitrophota bacterium]
MRRRRTDKREVMPDAKYNSKIIAKFINMVMECGKRSLAERIVYDALETAKEKLGEQDGLKIFNKAIENVRPRLEVKPRRVGGATYQVPIEVKTERGVSLALRWIRDLAKAKKGSPMEKKLSDEIIAAYKGEGSAIKKKDDTHKMAEANKAFAHFRW